MNPLTFEAKSDSFPFSVQNYRNRPLGRFLGCKWYRPPDYNPVFYGPIIDKLPKLGVPILLTGDGQTVRSVFLNALFNTSLWD
ncbi:Putative protein [Zobellia galactanivorans]|uniref:Uncharacterized protein n=1 Tax=Zobellia galactanivorans (strain DSM 12802 / CCUG 47099 / CIP 106680 / NCIMB 13871 / Dsij) TaxID=63186 RepID=G0L500_ZOBGA|nr:Putative protein [Zobellia galactanivorans]